MRFRPTFDRLGARIAPSTLAPAPATPPTIVVAAMDETGGPGSEGNGIDSYQILFTPPGNPPPPISTVC